MESTQPNLTNWRRNFYIFLTGQFLSGVTSMVVQYAIIWYLTMQTKSATTLSFASILGMLPMIFIAPLIGGIVDRQNKKMLLIVTDALVALFAVFLSIAGSISSTFPMWLVFVSLFMRALAQTFQSPTIQSALPAMVPSEELVRVNGQFSMIQSANFIISPALGAFMYSVMPLQYLILLDVIGFLIGAGLLLLVKIPDNRATVEDKVHPLNDAAIGFKELKKRHGLYVIIWAEAIFTLLFMPISSMYPLMTVQYFHGTVADAGVIEVVWSVGTLLGSLVIGLIKEWKDRLKPMIITSILVGVLVGASALLPGNKFGFIIFIILNTLAGFTVPFFNTMLMSVIQQSFTPEKLGRVIGIVSSLMAVSGPIGLIFAGPIGDAIGVQNIFLIGGFGSLVSALILIFNKSARNYDLKLKQELIELDSEK